MVLNRAQGLKKKSHEVSARKNINRLRYNKKCRGGRFRPPALLGLTPVLVMHERISLQEPILAKKYDIQFVKAKLIQTTVQVKNTYQEFDRHCKLNCAGQLCSYKHHVVGSRVRPLTCFLCLHIHAEKQKNKKTMGKERFPRKWIYKELEHRGWGGGGGGALTYESDVRVPPSTSDVGVFRWQIASKKEVFQWQSAQKQGVFQWNASKNRGFQGQKGQNGQKFLNILSNLSKFTKLSLIWP